MVNSPRPMPTYWLHEGKITMSMLADEADFIIGVDTHRDTNTETVKSKTKTPGIFWSRWGARNFLNSSWAAS
jgi:hypothetical protein